VSCFLAVGYMARPQNGQRESIPREAFHRYPQRPEGKKLPFPFRLVASCSGGILPQTCAAYPLEDNPLRSLDRAAAHTGLAVLLALSVSATSVIAGQEKKAADNPDQKEYSSYVLSMDKIQRLAVATKELKEWQDKNPQAAKELDANQSGDSVPLSTQVKLLDTKFPAGAAIIKKNGFATREYLVALYAYMQSVMIVSLRKAGQLNDASQFQGAVNQSNVTLVEKHWSEVEKLNASFSGSSQ